MYNPKNNKSQNLNKLSIWVANPLRYITLTREGGSLFFLQLLRNDTASLTAAPISGCWYRTVDPSANYKVPVVRARSGAIRT